MNFSQNQQEYFHFKIYSFFTNTYKWLIMRKLLKILQRIYTPCFFKIFGERSHQNLLAFPIYCIISSTFFFCIQILQM